LDFVSATTGIIAPSAREAAIANAITLRFTIIKKRVFFMLCFLA
jgi:predicted naringenin-chalcone synthase